MVAVNSSSIEMIGYAEDTKELFIQFRNGGMYVYERVPAWVHAALMQAESRGNYLNTEVKPNHAYRQVT